MYTINIPTNSEVTRRSTSQHIGAIYTHSNANWVVTIRQWKVLYMSTDTIMTTSRSWECCTVANHLGNCVTVNNCIINSRTIQSVGDVEFLLHNGRLTLLM